MNDRPYRVEITRRAQKDIARLTPKFKTKLRDILMNRIAVNPFDGKKLVGELDGYWSVRLTLKDRIVYSIDEQDRIVYILRARTHYGDS
ncbi:MAG: type II toxin-antitoxin system YoeB family toxin [Thermoanaerobaculales bacterium]